jgi:hypothetical protein
MGGSVTNTCVVCDRPTPDGYACREDAQELATALREAAGHAEDAETVIARQTRYGGGSRGPSDGGMTPNLFASATLARFQGVIGTWQRDLIETGRAAEPGPWRSYAGPLCAPARPGDEERDGNRCEHQSCARVREPRPTVLAQAVLWLADHLEEIRQHPAAAQAFPELTNACGELAWIVDRPAERDLVGVCDCGKVLYATKARAFITCPVPTCKLNWHVERSREILRKALGDKLVTLPEAARLAAYLDPDRTQDGIRKLIAARVGQLAPHGTLGEEPAYLFGDVAAMLAAIPKRRREPKRQEEVAGLAK